MARVFDDPTLDITSFATILEAAAAWTFSIDKIHYPEGPEDETGTACYLAQEGQQITVVYFSDTLSIGKLEQLATDISYQIPNQYRVDGTGVYIVRGPEAEQVQQAGDDDVAGDPNLARFNVVSQIFSIGPQGG